MVSNPTTSLRVFEEAGHTTVHFPAGTILAEVNVEDFERQLLAQIEGRDRPQLSLNLSGVSLLTSVALGKLVSLNARVREAGGRLTLVNLTPTVLQVFKVTRLDTLLEILGPTEALSA